MLPIVNDLLFTVQMYKGASTDYPSSILACGLSRALRSNEIEKQDILPRQRYWKKHLNAISAILPHNFFQILKSVFMQTLSISPRCRRESSVFEYKDAIRYIDIKQNPPSNFSFQQKQDKARNLDKGPY